jgi:hypothetical protein
MPTIVVFLDKKGYEEFSGRQKQDLSHQSDRFRFNKNPARFLKATFARTTTIARGTAVLFHICTGLILFFGYGT